MSDEVWKAMRAGPRQYLFEHVYLNPVAKREEAKVTGAYDYESLSYLYGKTGTHAGAIFEYAGRPAAASREQIACDYIAGERTDSYAVHTFEEYFIPKCWKN